VIPRANHALDSLPAAVFDGASVVLLQWELTPVISVAAARLGRAAGATVVLNPAPAVGSIADYAGLVDIVVPNESEAAVLGPIDGAQLVLTLGERGARVGDVDLAPHAVECVDTVGAGDAFCGALCAALADGASLVDAARIGNAAGALAVTKHGAEPSMPDKADIDALLHKISGC
jgi:ribokinase